MFFFSYNGYSVPDRTVTSTGLPTPRVFSSPPLHAHVIYIYSRPIVTTDYMPVFVGTFGGRARQLSSSLES